MLYRLRPPMILEWSGFPGFETFESVLERHFDFDRLDWKLAESLVFTRDLLRIAVRYGARSSTGLILDAQYTLDLGRAGRLRAVRTRGMGTVPAEQRATTGPDTGSDVPGRPGAGETLDADRCERTEREASRAAVDLGAILAAPTRDELTGHWVRLGGSLAD